MKNEELKNKTTKKGATSKGKDTKKKTTSKKDTNKPTKKKVEKKKDDIKVNIEEITKEVITEEESTKKVKITEEKKTKKKGDVFLILGLVLVIVIGFLLMRDKNAGPSYELPLTLSGEAGLHQLTYAEYQEKIDNGEEFVVILERATCSHCVTFMPIAEQFATDNNVPMYYVDTDTFTAEDWSNFEKSNSYLRKANGKWGTPTTLVLAGSETVGYKEGAVPVEQISELYTNYFDMGE